MENKNKFLKRLPIMGSLVIIGALLLSACNVISPPAPTPDPASQKATVDAAVAQALSTFSANMTSTAAALPTSTPTLTQTPAPTATATLVPPTPTKTRLPYTLTPSPTRTPSDLSCQVISTSPADGTKININTDFDAVWVVKNTGTLTWDVTSLDLKYVSGAKMQTMGDIFDINTEVAPGAQLTVIVDMKTPSTPGKYTALWMLTRDGTTALCSLPLSIEAVAP